MHNRDIDTALTYHEETKHSYDSVYHNHHFLDWDNQPRPFKLYVDLEPYSLPSTLANSHLPALQALAPSRDEQKPQTRVTLDDLAYILFYSAGVTKRRSYPGYGEMLFRAAACTGALYHIELYVAIADLPGLPAGLYHFGPVDFALRLLRQGDYRQVLVVASGSHVALQDAPIIVVGSGTLWRNAWKYRARAYRHSFWDSGTILANLMAAASARDFPARLVVGFADTQVNTLLGLDTEREVALFLVGLGRGEPQRTAPPVETLDLEVVPLSREEIDYPAIRIIHAASALDSPEAVVGWRDTLFPMLRSVVSGMMFPLCPELYGQLPEGSLESVIRKRGSARAFAHQSLSLAQLSNVLVGATQPIPADFLEDSNVRLNEIYLIVHAVADLLPGAYVFRGSEQSLELLKEGDFRHQAGVLALGQDLAADASVVVFFLCDLRLILEHYGNRGYRAAQLEAGILGGRMYLAAYGQGFSATGLTFFDDDVIEFFSPHAAGKSVMFLMAVGHAAQRRR